MTYVGFKMMMDRGLSSGLTMYMTEDDSPFNEDDSALSPLGKALHSFHETRYIGEKHARRSRKRRLRSTCSPRPISRQKPNASSRPAPIHSQVTRSTPVLDRTRSAGPLAEIVAHPSESISLRFVSHAPALHTAAHALRNTQRP
jgi:hypothetical protein